jgi:hypothetical protein
MTQLLFGQIILAAETDGRDKLEKSRRIYTARIPTFFLGRASSPARSYFVGTRITNNINLYMTFIRVTLALCLSI